MKDNQNWFSSCIEQAIKENPVPQSVTDIFDEEIQAHLCNEELASKDSAAIAKKLIKAATNISSELGDILK